MKRIRVFAGAAVAGGLAGVAGFAALHVLLARRVDPLREPVSAYALVPVGEVFFAVGALGFAVACASLAPCVRSGAARALLPVAAVMFVAVVLFPTDAGDAVSSLSGQVHRYAAGAAFVVMTVIGFAESLRSRGALAGLTVLSAATLLLTTVNTFLPWLADGGEWRGLPQRVLLVIQALMLVAMAVRAWAGRRVGGRRPVVPVVAAVPRAVS